MFTYISIEEFADGVVKNNKDTNRKELIASLRESLAAKKNGARCMICGAPIWAAGSGVTGTYLCFRRGRRQRGLRDRINNTRGCCTRKKSKCSSLFTVKCLQKHKNARHRPPNFQKADNSNRPF